MILILDTLLELEKRHTKVCAASSSAILMKNSPLCSESAIK